MKKALLITLLMAVGIFAQQKENMYQKSFFLGAEVGPTGMLADFGGFTPNVAGRVWLEYFLPEYSFGTLGFRLIGGGGWVSGDKNGIAVLGDTKSITTRIAYISFGPELVFNTSGSWQPYVMLSGGYMNFDPTNDKDKNITNGISPYYGSVKFNKNEFVAGAEAGARFPLSEVVTFNGSVNATYMFADHFDAYYGGDFEDMHVTLNLGIGIKLSGGKSDSDMDGVFDEVDMCPTSPAGSIVDVSGCPADNDKDGLTDDDEIAKFGTDPKKADTDGDGLNDKAELDIHKTSPVKADTDGDGLNDNEEINKYKTNALDADSDKDGLNDGAEVNTYKTNPLANDTDKDGLLDSSEINTHKTNPLEQDTDKDGLNDAVELNTHKTDPNKPDTDGGGVLDGVEIKRPSNPLDPKDDIQTIKIEKGQAIVLEGILFKTGSADILPESESVLNKVYLTLNENIDLEVEIQGHTDNKGNKKKNVELSLKRAESVKTWLVARGINASRVTTKGFGPDRPVAPNTTEDGRAKNRRIEFSRTK